MDFLKEYLGGQINFDIIGDGRYSGALVDIGPDLIVVFKESKFLYIPLHNVRHLSPELHSEWMSIPQMYTIKNNEEISYKTVLCNAKELFCEVYLSDRRSMHGYVTNIQNDYFVFLSPLGKLILIPLFHLKWMSPFGSSSKPYALSGEKPLLMKGLDSSFAQTFREQLKKQEGSVVSLNDGLNTNAIGKLQKFEHDIVNLVGADETNHYFHVQHLINVCIR